MARNPVLVLCVGGYTDLLFFSATGRRVVCLDECSRKGRVVLLMSFSKGIGRDSKRCWVLTNGQRFDTIRPGRRA